TNTTPPRQTKNRPIAKFSATCGLVGWSRTRAWPPTVMLLDFEAAEIPASLTRWYKALYRSVLVCAVFFSSLYWDILFISFIMSFICPVIIFLRAVAA